jgi:hypothetical protein
VTDKLELGMEIGYDAYQTNYSTPRRKDIVGHQDHTFFVGPFIQIYRMTSDKFDLFLRVDGGIGFGKETIKPVEEYNDSETIEDKSDIKRWKVSVSLQVLSILSPTDLALWEI